MRTVISPATGLAWLNLREIWTQRELVGFLVWRNIKVRYKQTVIGVAWALLQPLFPMVVFTMIFGHLAKMPSEGLPYPIFAYCALLPWQLFSQSLNESANNLSADERLITKVYFPRFVIPTSTVLAALLDFKPGEIH